MRKFYSILLTLVINQCIVTKNVSRVRTGGSPSCPYGPYDLACLRGVDDESNDDDDGGFAGRKIANGRSHPSASERASEGGDHLRREGRYYDTELTERRMHK